MEFKIGDRVKTVGLDCGEGIIVDHKTCFWGVRFDNKRLNFHDCSGKCELGHGFYLLSHYIEKINLINYDTLTEIEE